MNNIKKLIVIFSKEFEEYPGYDTKQSDGALGNTEHPFIAIAPRSTLTRRGSTW